MKRRTRTILWVFGLLLLAGLAAGAALLGPRLGATRALITFGWKVPDDLESLDKLAAGYELLEGASLFGLEHVLVRRVGDGAEHPSIVFVHGVAPVGLRDGRVLRAIERLVVVVPCPGLEIEIACQGDDTERVLHTFRKQHRQRPSAAMPD